MNRKRVLVTPLDWGLGHATRCIPIIRLLIDQGCEVFLGGSGHTLELLQKEFSALRCVTLPAYDPVYPTSGSMAWSMLIQFSKFRKAIRGEHRIVERYLQSHLINYVISDNRYGCWSVHAHAVFITHQTNIIMPQGLGWIGGILNYFNRKQIKKFSQCWIPDFSDHTFSGTLSKSVQLKKRFIGPLSRFTKSPSTVKKYDVLILLSGPEPQRTNLEKLLTDQLSSMQSSILIVKGVKEDLNKKVSSQVTIVNFLNSEQLQLAIEQSELVISRPGYSTIMDLAKLKKKAIFIPTPGQTEQEYLAVQLKEKGIAYFETQNDFDLCKAIRESEKYSGFNEFDFSEQLLSSAIRELLMLH